MAVSRVSRRSRSATIRWRTSARNSVGAGRGVGIGSVGLLASLAWILTIAPQFLKAPCGVAVSDAPTPPKIAGFDGRFRSPVPAWRVTEFDLRRYESADRNAVWVVHERAFRASPTPHDPELNRYLRHVEEFYLDAGGEFLVATVAVPPADPGEYGPEDERVVGVGGFLPSTVEESSVRGTAPVDPDPDTVEFRSLRVDPEYQRVGIARALVTDLEERASDRGFERVVLDTGVDLEAAQALYESMGYERAGRESIAGFELIYYEKWLST